MKFYRASSYSKIPERHWYREILCCSTFGSAICLDLSLLVWNLRLYRVSHQTQRTENSLLVIYHIFWVVFLALRSLLRWGCGWSTKTRYILSFQTKRNKSRRIQILKKTRRFLTSRLWLPILGTKKNNGKFTALQNNGKNRLDGIFMMQEILHRLDTVNTRKWQMCNSWFPCTSYAFRCFKSIVAWTQCRLFFAFLHAFFTTYLVISKSECAWCRKVFDVIG